MTQGQIKDFILKLEHELTARKRCFDLVSILLTESTDNLDHALKLMTENLKDYEATQNFVSEAKKQFFKVRTEDLGLN